MSRFWTFAQLSDKFKGLDAMNQLEEEPIYIGGLRALERPQDLDAANITHILSILDFDPCDFEGLAKYQRLLVQVDDDPSEDLLKHFDSTNTFIKSALADGGTVLVHCAMGISRSATVLCAYLMHTKSITSQRALEMVRGARPFCVPNDGFMEQLAVYERMLKAGSKNDATRLYDDWLESRVRSSKI